MKVCKHLSRLLLANIFLVVASCNSDRLPEGVIDSATFTSFLTEAHLIEGYVEIIGRQDIDSAEHIAQRAYDSLYAKYGITPSDYDSSMYYYVHHPKMMEDIYGRVEHRIRAMQP